jgi:hypothetical protein
MAISITRCVIYDSSPPGQLIHTLAYRRHVG